MNNKKGFTLVELLATIVVIALVSTIATISITGVVKNTKKDIGNINEEEINKAADLYFTTNYKYFKNGSISSFDLYTLRDEKYIDSIPIDEEGNEVNKVFVYNVSEKKVLSYNETNSNNFEFNSSSGTIVEYTGTEKNVVIPSYINGEKVTVIDNNAFFDNNLTSVIIANGVTTIEKNAFAYCGKLKSVTIPSSVTNIGDSAFTGTALKTVNIPYGVTTIEKYAFAYCDKLESVTIPDSVISISDNAFIQSGLTSVTIPNSVKTIGAFAFNGNNILNLVIGSGVTEIGDRAFNTNMVPDEQSYIYKRNSDGSIDKTTLIGYAGNSEDIIIPDGVVTIGDYALENYKLGYKNITLPSSVMNIGKYGITDPSLSPGQVTIKGKTSLSEFTSLGQYWAPSKSMVYEP